MVTISTTPSLENIPGLDVPYRGGKMRASFADTYDTSLDYLPSHVLIVDRFRGLEEIKSKKINLVIWKREEDEEISEFFKNVLTPKNPSMIEEEHYRLGRILRNFPNHDGAIRLREMHSTLFGLMGNLQRDNHRYFSFEDREVSGFAFHQDNGYSLNWTPYGPGALWVPNGLCKKENDGDYKAPDDHSLIRQFKAGWIGIYKGELDSKKNALGEPLIHSRPPRGDGVRRALIQIYL